MMVGMMAKFNILIKFHSIVDVITNSSTEIFCQIKSQEFLNEIKAELESILHRPLYVDTSARYDIDLDDWVEDLDCISFSIEHGCEEMVTEDFRNLIDAVLKPKFGDSYQITHEY